MRVDRYDEIWREARAADHAAQAAGTPLFAPPGAGPWPERPALGDAEQGDLTLPGTAAERYRCWRQTAESEEVLALLRAIALEWLAEGARQIGSRGLWEEARHRRRRSVDNRLQALACREVELTTPALRGRFRHRVRSEG